MFLFVLEKDCGKPASIQNGVFSGSTLYGDQLKVTCKPGYTKSPRNSTLECGPGGRWLGNMPKCIGECQVIPIMMMIL